MVRERVRSDHRSKIAALWEMLIASARNQNAGGGRINWVVTERKIGDTSAAKLAKAVVAKIGADATVCVLIPACAVAQIEQVWWDVVEFSECEWVACTAPITHIRTTQSTRSEEHTSELQSR